MTLASAFSSAPLWYTTRATAIVAFVLMTVTMTLGLAATQRAVASRAWPRFATQDLHRNLSLLAMGFVLLHIVTTLSDSFVTVGWWSLVIPGASAYRTVWTAFGTLAFDLAMLLVVSSLLRHRLSLRAWRAVHFSAYALWPLAFVHFWKTGTDASHGRWGLWLDIVCLLALTGAVAIRAVARNEPQPVTP